MSRLLTLFLLFFLPLIVLPFGTSYFETPKVIIAELTIELLVLLFLFRKHDLRHFFANQKPIVALFLLSFMHVLLVAPSGFFGNQFRLQGVFLFWHLLMWSLVAWRSDTHLHRHGWKYIVVSLVWILGTLGHHGANAAGQMVGTLGEPNALAAVLVFFIPFLLYHQGSQRTRLLHSATFLSICFLIAITGSRAAGWAIFLQALVHVLSHRWHMSLSRIVVSCLFLLACSSVLPFLDTPRALESRAEIWQTAWFSGWEHPLIGSGFGTVEYALRQTAIGRSNNLRFQYVDSSHNFLLDWWIQGGIVGVGILAWIFYIRIRSLIQAKEELYLCVLLGIMTVMFFNPVSIATLIHFWWLMGTPHTSIDS